MKEFSSHPHFGERVPEDIGIPSEQKEQKVALEQIELARAAWIGAIETLARKVAHDAVMIDDRTFAYSVIRNAWLANLMELADLEDAIREQSSFDAN